jgi:hypothetical protein
MFVGYNMKNIVLSLDLGAVNTGYYLCSYDNNADFIDTSLTDAGTVVVNPDKIKFSQEERRIVRHRIRGFKRFKFARALLDQIVTKLLGNSAESLDSKELMDLKICLSGLLKRRGYTRFEQDIDETDISNFFIEDYYKLIIEPLLNCNGGLCIPNDLAWASDATIIDLIQSLLEFSYDNYSFINSQLVRLINVLDSLNKPQDILDEFGDSVDSSIIGIIQSFDGTERKSLKRSMQEILKFVENWNNENQLGNKHRKKYFEDINLEIERDSRLSRFLKITGLNERQLANLIGNISNLQLRGLRRYFSSENKQPVTVFDPEKLKNAFIYNLNYNHKDNNNRDHWNEIQKAKQLFKTNSVIEVLKELDPCATIPCYEDMNNRNPPKDQTLLLNPDVLNKEYLNWKVWVDRIVDDYKCNEQFQIDYHIEHIYKLTDRKSRIPVQVGGVYVKKDDENYKYSYLLQRIMDRTISADPYRIKSLCKNSRSQIAIQNAESKERCDNGRLRRLLGENEFAQFMIFADKYYKEVDSARAGCWLLTDSSLFELSNINPPKKNSIKHILIENIFGQHVSDGEFKFENFKELWTEKDGRSSLRSLCSKIEEIRKKYGNYYNDVYHEVSKKRLVANSKFKDEFADVNKSIEYTEQAVKILEKNINRLNIDNESVMLVNNPYSLSQIFNLMEKDLAGFSSNVLAVHLENACRMKKCGDKSLCTRLPADSIRPIDGIVARITDREAFELSEIIVGYIKKLDQNINLKNEHLSLIVALEKNEFSYEVELNKDIKNNKNKKEKYEKLAKKQTAYFDNKENRIKKSSHDICPYTGYALTNDGEIDHIIPRAETRSRCYAVFNSEANLIYCSKKGNQDKTNKTKLLSDLNPDYLFKVFGTRDVNEIREKIGKEVNRIKNEYGSNIVFHALSENEQICLRHALFLEHDSEIFKMVLALLNTRPSNIVNGTQGYFAKCLNSKISQNLSFNKWLNDNGIKLDISFVKTPLDDNRIVRDKVLGIPKQKNQPIFSHSVDAFCSFLSAVKNCSHLVDFNMSEKLDNKLANPELSENRDFINSLLPESLKAKAIESKNCLNKDESSYKFTKDGIYAMKFINIIGCDGKLFAGFDTNESNSVCLDKRKLKKINLLSDYYVNNDGIKGLNLDFNGVWKIDKTRVLTDYFDGKLSDEQCKVLQEIEYSTQKRDLTDILFPKDNPILLKEINFTESLKNKNNSSINQDTIDLSEFAAHIDTLKIKLIGQVNANSIDFSKYTCELSFFTDCSNGEKIYLGTSAGNIVALTSKTENLSQIIPIVENFIEKKLEFENGLKEYKIPNNCYKEYFVFSFLNADIYEIPRSKLFRLKIFNKNLMLPSGFDLIYKFIKNQSFIENLYLRKSNNLSDSEIIQNALKKIFKPNGDKKTPHHASRRVYSLPCIANPSGGLIIRRMNYDHSYIYQQVACGSRLYKAFAKVNDPKHSNKVKIDANSAVLADFVSNSANVKLSEFENDKGKNVQFFDFTKVVDLDINNDDYNFDQLGIRQIQMSLSTESRAKLIVTIEKDKFVRLLARNQQHDLFNSFEFDFHMKLNNKFDVLVDDPALYEKELTILSKPRENKNKECTVTIVEVTADNVTFTYDTNSKPSSSTYDLFSSSLKECDI